MPASITPAFDLFKFLKAESASVPADKGVIADALDQDLNLDLQHNPALQLALTAKLQNLDKAIEKLKTVPAEEGKEELTMVVEALLPLSAYSLSDANPLKRKEALNKLYGLFKQFEDSYAKKYSAAAEAEALKNGKPINAAELATGRAVLTELNHICRKRVEDLNENDMPHLQEIQAFLLKINAKDHPLLLDPMVADLHKFRRENMNNFQRAFDNYRTNAFKSLQNATSHADYQKGWEQVGYWAANFLFSFVDPVVYSLTAQQIPLHENKEEAAPTFQPVNGRPVRMAAPAA